MSSSSPEKVNSRPSHKSRTSTRHILINNHGGSRIFQFKLRSDPLKGENGVAALPLYRAYCFGRNPRSFLVQIAVFGDIGKFPFECHEQIIQRLPRTALEFLIYFRSARPDVARAFLGRRRAARFSAAASSRAGAPLPLPSFHSRRKRAISSCNSHSLLGPLSSAGFLRKEILQIMRVSRLALRAGFVPALA